MKKEKSKAGRKKLDDPKDTVVLFIPRSSIVGKENIPIEKNSPLYLEKIEEMKAVLYESVNLYNQ